MSHKAILRPSGAHLPAKHFFEYPQVNSQFTSFWPRLPNRYANLYVNKQMVCLNFGLAEMFSDLRWTKCWALLMNGGVRSGVGPPFCWEIEVVRHSVARLLLDISRQRHPIRIRIGSWPVIAFLWPCCVDGWMDGWVGKMSW